MKHADVQLGKYIEYGLENYGKDHKFQSNDCARMSKYKDIFLKGYTLNWYEEVLVTKEIKKYCAMDICY